VLHPGGALIVTTPNLASLENRLRLLLGRYPMWMDVGVNGAGHLRYYTPRMLRHQLARHGLSVERHVGNWVPLLPQRLLDGRRALPGALAADGREPRLHPRLQPRGARRQGRAPLLREQRHALRARLRQPARPRADRRRHAVRGGSHTTLVGRRARDPWPDAVRARLLS